VRIFLIFLLAFGLLSGCGAATLPKIQGETAVTVWFPDFDMTRAAQSFKTNSETITQVNPVWYLLDGEGKIQSMPSVNQPEVLNVAKSVGIQVVPSILNMINEQFDPTPVVRIARDSALRKAHARDIARIVTQQGYDGIELDYESIPKEAAADFSALVAEVRNALPTGKVLSIAVHAKKSPTQNWNGPGGQIWEDLLRHVDYFKIMLYDYSWLNSAPGPIAPLGWMRDVLLYARNIANKTGVSSQRIIAGMPFYGYDWGSDLPASEANWNKIGAIKANSKTVNISETRDALSGEPVLRYRMNGNEHVVYYQDETSINGRLKMLIQEFPEFGGIAYWRLGAEDPRSWESIKKYVKTRTKLD
jgi:spore germination protein